MIKKLIARVLQPRHFWRTVGFDELSELYTSMMLRGLALNLVGLFVPIYLYQIGYGIQQIAFFYAMFFGARLCFDYVAAQVVGRYGPKHTMMISYMLQVVSILLLLALKTTPLPMWALAIVWGSASSLYYVGYHVDFSKIKHSEHGGKEVGYTFVLDRMSAVLGPLAGGFIAAYAGAQYTIMASAIVFAVALVPLYLTKEPVRTHQQVRFRGLAAVFRRDALSVSGLSIENSLSVILWPLYVSVVVFAGNPYAKIGILSAVGVSVAIFAARMTGKITDQRRGRELLNYALVCNIAIHGFRLFAKNFVAVLGVNMANEAVTVGYRIPYTKGMYDAADELEGRRIAYIAMMEMTADVAKILAWSFIGVLCSYTSPMKAMQVGFLLAMIASACIMTQRFPALQKQTSQKLTRLHT